MADLIYLPAIMLVISGMAIPLLDYGEQTSDKVLNNTISMVNALDCAYAGIELKYCSPELFNNTLKQDLIDFDSSMTQLNLSGVPE